MPKELTDEERGILENCNTYEYYQLTRRVFESGGCGFCTIDSKINHVIYENDHWLAWENVFPSERACKVMLVIVSRAHLRSLGDIPKDAWSALHDVLQWAEDRYDLPGGMFFARFGDMRLNAGTVPHFHWNLWVPDKTKELKIPVFKDPEKQEANRRRAAEFAARYEAEMTS